MVPIVQLAERLTVDQKVVGSRPTGHPEYLSAWEVFFIQLKLLHIADNTSSQQWDYVAILL